MRQFEDQEIPEPDEKALTEHDHVTSPLAGELLDRLEEWKQKRGPQEEEHLQNYRDRERISHGQEHRGTGMARARKARKIDVGMTRNKIRTATAKIDDALFGQGRWPIDVDPTNKELKDFAALRRNILHWRLKDAKFDITVGESGLLALATYGTGWIAGPFTRNASLVYTEIKRKPVLDPAGNPVPDPETGEPLVDPETGEPVADEQGNPVIDPDTVQPLTEIDEIIPHEHEYKELYFEALNNFDTYPDPHATDELGGLGIYTVTRHQPEEVAEWEEDESYRNIPWVLKNFLNHDTWLHEGSEKAKDEKLTQHRFSDDGRIVVVKYYGKVRLDHIEAWEAGEDLSQADILEPNSHERTLKRVEAVVVIAGGVVIKCGKSPYRRRPIYRAVWELDENKIDGVGIAKNNHVAKSVLNAMLRVYIETKGLAATPPRSIDRSLFRPSEDFQQYPGKTYDFKPGVSADERRAAIIQHDYQDVSQGLEVPMGMMERFSDEDTGVNQYTSGNNATHLNDTAAGISMLMNAANMPLKKVIRNIDRHWIAPITQAIIDYDRVHLEAETVAHVFGEEEAIMWKAIQDTGEIQWLKLRTTGTNTFVQKELGVQKIQAFLAIASTNPEISQRTKYFDIAKAMWEFMEIGPEAPFYTEEEFQAMQQAAQEAEAAAAQNDPMRMKFESDAQNNKAKNELKARELGIKEESVVNNLVAQMAKIEARLEEAELRKG